MKIKIPLFETARVLVVGDLMLDRYWHGDATKISPEAPVPVVHVQQIEDRVGGAGNVAINVSALGGKVQLLGLVGNDEAAKSAEKYLQEHHVACDLLCVANHPTITKLRVMGRNQQLIRLDIEDKFTEFAEDEFLQKYREKLTNSDLVILSDYGKGTLKFSAKLIALAQELHLPVLVDPKSLDFSCYQGATVITPNFHEFEAVVGQCENNAVIEAKALKLIEQHKLQAVLITRGAQGMSLITKDKPAVHLPTRAREVYDVTGAGDTVIATLGAALATGEDLYEAMVLANAAAGIVVRKLGAATVSPAELRRAMQRQQDPWAAILDEEHLLQQIADARAHGEKIVMTNGCFDILHAGHVIYLEKAKSLGKRLIVAVNDDASVKRLKGAKRPINTVQSRMLLLAALGAVDWVIPFSEDTPERLIKKIAPDVLVKGGDYKKEEIAGADFVLQNGGEVIIVPFEPGFSTSSMLQKIEQLKLK